MGFLREQIVDSDRVLDLPGMTDEELFQTIRNLMLSDQIGHYKPGEKPTTLLEFLGMIFVVCAGAGFVLFFWAFLPRILS